MYVYVLQSVVSPKRFYVGLTDDPERRLAEHNSGRSVHTNRFRPWKQKVVIWFEDPSSAARFEKYLKSGSGRAFARRHF